MNIFSLIGAVVITLSFLSYGIGSISIQRFKTISSGILVFITLGVCLDIVAVAFMVAGSHRTNLSLHSILGLSATLMMMVNMFLIWKLYSRKGLNANISKPIINYSKIAYTWWVIAYLTGSLLVLW